MFVSHLFIDSGRRSAWLGKKRWEERAGTSAATERELARAMTAIRTTADEVRGAALRAQRLMRFLHLLR